MLLANLRRVNQQIFALLVVATAITLASASEMAPLTKLSNAELDARFSSDLRQIEVERKGMQDVLAFMSSRPDLFPAEKPNEPRLLRREEKEVVWPVWQRFGDYLAAMQSVADYHADFHRLRGAAREDSFLIGTAGLLGSYRLALEFIQRVENNPELDKVLNDAVPELGLASGSYARLKFKFLNVAMATQFAARSALMSMFPGARRPELRGDIQTDSDYLWKAGRGQGTLMTARNALKVVQNTAATLWLPIQTGVSEWMGHTKVYRLNQPLISLKQIREAQSKMQPGDILLERREWYLSNIGLPGFWSHAALHIGTPAERTAYFRDPEVKHWLAERKQPVGDLEELLRISFPAAYEMMRNHKDPPVYPEQKDSEKDSVRILEAISEGVSFHSLEHSAACDCLVVLRPRLSKLEKARALFRAFGYAGRPYDFDFDFSTDAKLVCTELVYKSYEPAGPFRGLTFPTVEMLGRRVAPANEFAKQFDAQFGNPEQQTDLVLFLDGQERLGKAIESGVVEFRQSWKRPKWHVLEPGTEGK
jgi:hypothetical protein